MFTATADAPAPEGNPQPASVAYVEPLGPGAAATFNLNLEPGRTYSVTCFMSDREGGAPHVTKGMWGAFTVPAK